MIMLFLKYLYHFKYPYQKNPFSSFSLFFLAGCLPRDDVSPLEDGSHKGQINSEVSPSAFF